MVARTRGDRIQEYWSWFAVALFVLITVDMLTTVYAVAAVGAAAEANPLVRWAIGRGIAVVAAVNLAAVVVAVGGFFALMRLVESAREPWRRYVELAVEAWLGLLLAAGLVVFANNLAVIVHGRSILPFF